jgi:hypothetical protein
VRHLGECVCSEQWSSQMEIIALAPRVRSTWGWAGLSVCVFLKLDMGSVCCVLASVLIVIG